MSMRYFALGVVWIVITIIIAMAMANLVVTGNLNDCERLGKFRYGETVIECKVVKQ